MGRSQEPGGMSKQPVNKVQLAKLKEASVGSKPIADFFGRKSPKSSKLSKLSKSLKASKSKSSKAKTKIKANTSLSYAYKKNEKKKKRKKIERGIFAQGAGMLG